MIEVAKKSGERHLSKTVYGIICGIRRYLEENDADEGKATSHHLFNKIFSYESYIFLSAISFIGPYFVEHWTRK